MGYVLVLVIAVAVGVGVYLLPGRSGRDDGARTAASGGQGGSLEIRPGDDRGSEPDGRGYIPVLGHQTSWHSRLGGAFGLIVMIGVSSVVLALILYQAGVLISRIFSSTG